MSLEGLRAWIGEVERKLGMRTRAFLVLALIAIGGAGAAIYLAIDTRNSSVSESDVRALQEKLEARIDEVAASAPASPSEEPEAVAPAPESIVPESEAAKPESGGRSKPNEGGGGGSEAGKRASGTPGSATGGAASATELQELVEEAKRKQAEAEGK